MKRFISALLMVLFASYAVADGTRSFTDKVTAGSLTVTNNAEEGSAFELKRVEFKLVAAALTNVFSIIQNRLFQLPDATRSVVETNVFDATVTTSTVRYIGGSATFTHTNTIATTTNDVTVQVYDETDFGVGWLFEEEDIATFSFTDTNTLYLIRTYNVYDRP